MKNICKLRNIIIVFFLMLLAGCATSSTLVKKPTEVKDNETFVLLGKARIDSFSEWREKDLVSIFCLNILTKEEVECFPQENFTTFTKKVEKNKSKRAVYSSSEIYTLPIGKYKITKIKYARAVSTRNGIPEFQYWDFDLPKNNRIPFELTKNNEYLGRVLLIMGYDNTIRPVIRSLKIVDHFNGDKSRVSKRRKSLFNHISEKNEFKNRALKTEIISFKDQYTRYGEWGSLSKYSDLDKCNTNFFKVIDGKLTAKAKEWNALGNPFKRFQGFGNVLLSKKIACGLYKHMASEGFTEFKFTGNPDFNAKKLKSTFAGKQKTLKIPVLFR